MRRVLLVVLIAVLGLALVFPTIAAAPGKGEVKLRVFVHYPRQGKPGPQPGICNITDITSSVYGLTGWKLTRPFVYRVNYGSLPSTVSASDAKAVIATSFKTWQTESGVSLTEGSPTSVRGYKYDGQNVVVWGRVSGGAIAVTYTWYYPSTGEVAECDTVMGTSLPWKVNPSANADSQCGDLYYYDVQDILTHEVGHWLGLDDLYSDPEEDLTMYGYGDKGELKKDTLMTGDKNGIAAIY